MNLSLQNVKFCNCTTFGFLLQAPTPAKSPHDGS